MSPWYSLLIFLVSLNYPITFSSFSVKSNCFSMQQCIVSNFFSAIFEFTNSSFNSVYLALWSICWVFNFKSYITFLFLDVYLFVCLFFKISWCFFKIPYSFFYFLPHLSIPVVYYFFWQLLPKVHRSVKLFLYFGFICDFVCGSYSFWFDSQNFTLLVSQLLSISVIAVWILQSPLWEWCFAGRICFGFCPELVTWSL